MGPGQVEAKVWTRARLAELCGITESQAVEWALLLGNDYTENLVVGVFDPSPFGGRKAIAEKVM